jgi:hypothetical protein
MARDFESDVLGDVYASALELCNALVGRVKLDDLIVREEWQNVTQNMVV